MNFVILGLARLTRIYNKSTDLETLLRAMRNWKCSQEKVEARFFYYFFIDCEKEVGNFHKTGTIVKKILGKWLRQ